MEHGVDSLKGGESRWLMSSFRQLRLN